MFDNNNNNTLAPSGKKNALISPLTTTVIGAMVAVSSFIFMLMNIVIIKAIVCSKELLKINAYQFMVAIAVADTGNSFVCVWWGAITIARRPLTDLSYLGEIIEIINVPIYVFFALITIILAVNRFILTYSPTLDREIFSKIGMKIWFLFCIGIAVVYLFAYGIGCAQMTYDWTLLSWQYNFDLPCTEPLRYIESVMEIYGFMTASLLYILTFLLIIRKRNSYVATPHKIQWKIFFQSFTITAYATLHNVFWHYHELVIPNTVLWHSLPTLMSVLNGAVNPIIYFITNVSMRRQLVPKIGITNSSKTIVINAANSLEL